MVLEEGTRFHKPLQSSSFTAKRLWKWFLRNIMVSVSTIGISWIIWVPPECLTKTDQGSISLATMKK